MNGLTRELQDAHSDKAALLSALEHQQEQMEDTLQQRLSEMAEDLNAKIQETKVNEEIEKLQAELAEKTQAIDGPVIASPPSGAEGDVAIPEQDEIASLSTKLEVTMTPKEEPGPAPSATPAEAGFHSLEALDSRLRGNEKPKFKLPSVRLPRLTLPRPSGKKLALVSSVLAVFLLVSFASAHPAEVGRILGYPSSLGLSYGNAVIEAANDTFSDLGEGWDEVTDTAVALIPSLPKLKTPHLPPRSIGARLAQMDLGGTFDLRIPHFDLSRWGDSLLSLLPRRGEMSRAKPRDRDVALPALPAGRHFPHLSFENLIGHWSLDIGHLPKVSFSKTTRSLSEGWLSLQKDFSSRIAWLADDLTASVTRSYRTLASLPTRSQRPLSQPLSPTSLSLGEAGTPGERGFSSPSSPGVGRMAEGQERSQPQIIERIVLRDIQIIEKAVPGPRGEPGKDGIAFVSHPPASSFPPTPAEAPASTRFGEAGGVHSPNEDLDSRLPLGHELEVE